MRRRVLSTLLALCMVLGMLPGVAWAADTEPGSRGEPAAMVITESEEHPCDTLEEAVEYSENFRHSFGKTATIKMLANYFADYFVNDGLGLIFESTISSPTVTLDLNGCSLVGNITNSDHLIIEDSAGNGVVNGTIVNVNNYSYLEIAGGTFHGKFASEGWIDDRDPGAGPLTVIKGGKILFAGMVVENGSLEISGGDIILEDGLELNHSNLRFSGGTFNGKIDGLYDWGNNLTITGGTIWGTTENGQRWSLTNKVLTISGTGTIPDYESHLDTPWDYLTAGDSEYPGYVESIDVKDGITRIGDRAFAFYSGKTLTLPNTLTSIGEFSIGFTQLASLEIPASVTKIEAGAFDSSVDGLKLKFLGSAPTFEINFKDNFLDSDYPVFCRCDNITIYYPSGDESWTRHLGENFGAYHVEWKPYSSSDPTPGPDDPDPSVLHGKVTVNAKYALSGATVLVTLTPDPGYIAKGVTVTGDVSGKTIGVTGSGTTYFFQMPLEDVTIHAEFVPEPL